jgi:hypothetical protein
VTEAAEQWYNITTAAQALQVSESTFRENAALAKVPGRVRHGRARWFTAAEVAQVAAYRQQRRQAVHVSKLDRVTVDAATLRAWVEAGETLGAIGTRLGLGSWSVRVLLGRHGVPPTTGHGCRCACGEWWAGHRRCTRCGFLLCEEFPKHGPGVNMAGHRGLVCAVCAQELARKM